MPTDDAPTDPDDFDPDAGFVPSFPALARFAGILWLLYGLSCFGGLLAVWLAGNADLKFRLVFWVLILGGKGLSYGLTTVFGTADRLGRMGWQSLGFAAVTLGLVYFALTVGRKGPDPVLVIVLGVQTVLLASAGVLARLGRHDYEAWQAAHHTACAAETARADDADPESEPAAGGGCRRTLGWLCVLAAVPAFAGVTLFLMIGGAWAAAMQGPGPNDDTQALLAGGAAAAVFLVSGVLLLAGGKKPPVEDPFDDRDRREP